MERQLTDLELIEMQNLAAMMMTEMPEHRHEYKSEGLPLEGFDPFFRAPLDLQGIMNTLCEDLGRLDGIAVTANRFSERYMSVSRQLEGLVRQVGRICLTFAVLEQQGQVLTYPKKMTISRLYDIAGYHFNKAHAAVKGTQLVNLRFYLGMLAQEARWAVLLGRLKATEEKIGLIREGKITADPKTRKAGTKDPAQSTKASAPADPASGPLRSGMTSALPVCSDMLSMGEPIAEPLQPAIPETAAPAPAVQITAPETAVTKPDDPEIEMTSEEEAALDDECTKRIIMMEEAEARGDSEASEMICSADRQTLETLWEAFMKADGENGYPIIRNSGLCVFRYDQPPPAWALEVFGSAIC